MATACIPPQVSLRVSRASAAGGHGVRLAPRQFGWWGRLSPQEARAIVLPDALVIA
jgi:hypothetical protein